MLTTYNFYIKIYNKFCKLNNMILQENLLYLSLIIASFF